MIGIIIFLFFVSFIWCGCCLISTKYESDSKFCKPSIILAMLLMIFTTLFMTGFYFYSGYNVQMNHYMIVHISNETQIILESTNICKDMICIGTCVSLYPIDNICVKYNSTSNCSLYCYKYKDKYAVIKFCTLQNLDNPYEFITVTIKSNPKFDTVLQAREANFPHIQDELGVMGYLEEENNFTTIERIPWINSTNNINNSEKNNGKLIMRIFAPFMVLIIMCIAMQIYFYLHNWNKNSEYEPITL